MSPNKTIQFAQTQLPNIAAVIVTYQPILAELDELLSALLGQVKAIAVVDNGSNNFSDVAELVAKAQALDRCNIHLQALDSNLGVSAAQNVGIAFAANARHSHVVLFDQDSRPAENMIDALLKAETTLLQEGNRVAAVGPCYFDSRQSNPPPFIAVQGLSLKRYSCDVANDIHPVDYLISSGCLLRISVINAVGPMNEELFIDYIDIEWGLRAKQAGFQSYGVCAAKMHHQLGDTPVVFFGKKIPLHSPLRHYYHFRNAIALYLRHPVPLNWKLVDGSKLVLKFGFYSIFTTNRLAHFLAMLTGIKDGVLNQLGQKH